MFRRTLTLLVLLALSTAVVNRLTYASVLTSSATAPESKKEKRKCAPCSAVLESTGALDQIDKLATLGRRTQVQPLAPVGRSVFEGATVNFVSTATGQLAFAVTDLEVTGALPFPFRRIYSSDRSEDTGLGAGWSFLLDDRITLENDKAMMKTGTGAVIAFRREAGSNRFRLQTDSPLPHQSFEVVDEATLNEQAGGFRRTYTKVGDSFRLSRIADGSGNSISIGLDARGQISRVESSSGGELTLEWSSGEGDPRLLSVSDNAGRRVAFKQDGKRLLAMTDPAGAQWTYDYEGVRLSRASDPLKRTLLRVRYDRTGRVVEAGDATGAHLYDYDSNTATISRRTTITDPMGAKVHVEHSESGVVTSIAEGEGQWVRFEFNAANRPARIFNSFGDETKFTYDAQHRLLQHRATDGTDKSYGYDARGRISSVTEGGVRTDYTLNDDGQIVAAKSSDQGRASRATYNARGQLVSLKSESREVSFEYDGRGNNTAFAYSDVGRFGLERDAAGRVVKESFPSGLNIFNEYDARGWLMKQSNNRGRSMRVERDPSGAPAAYVRGDGKRLSLARDGTGRIVAMTDFNNLTRRYVYNARGALTDYTDAKGRRFRYEYDRQGRLSSITGAGNMRVTIERDERGRIKRLAPPPSAGRAAIRGGKLLAHAAQDMDDPNIDWGDPLIIDVWERYYTDYPRSGGMVGGDGSMFLPMEGTGTEGGTGGTETCEQCISRIHNAASYELVMCLLRLAIPGGLTAALSCAGLVASGLVTSIGAPAAAYICGVVVSVAIGVSCIYEAAAKYERARDSCPVCQ